MSGSLLLEAREQSSAVEIYQQLHADILSCAMAPGTQFRERQIAERFNVSKSPVRDALIKLQEQNLVQVIPRKGYRVTRISLTDARDLYEMRLILEREAIVRLIEQGSESDHEKLDPFRDLASKAVDHWVEYNRSFHIRIAELCGNQRLTRMGREVIEQFDRLTRVSVNNSLRPDPLSQAVLDARMEEHRAIIDAIQAKDKRRATTISRDHIEGSRKRLMSVLESASIAI